MAKIDAFFNLMFEQKASDLHLSSNNNPMLRINGELNRVEHPPLENDELKKMLYEIAPEYKIKVFEETGETVCAHIRARRLAMCRRDIEGTTLANRPISEIAHHWGFEDPSHFSKVFRAAYGMTPSELRAQGRGSARQA